MADSTVDFSYECRTYLRKSISWNCWASQPRARFPSPISGKVLAGPYKGSMLASLAQDIQDETSAIQSMHTLTAAETAYSGTYPPGFTDSLEKLGPATGAPDQNHAGLIDITLATGTKDGYQFGITIPAGTSTGGSNFNYFLVAKPASGHAGRTFCADSSGTVRYAEQGQDCSDFIASPVTTGSPPRAGIHFFIRFAPARRAHRPIEFDLSEAASCRSGFRSEPIVSFFL